VSIIPCSTAEEQGWRMVVARERVLSRLTAKPEVQVTIHRGRQGPQSLLLVLRSVVRDKPELRHCLSRWALWDFLPHASAECEAAGSELSVWVPRRAPPGGFHRTQWRTTGAGGETEEEDAQRPAAGSQAGPSPAARRRPLMPTGAGGDAVPCRYRPQCRHGGQSDRGAAGERGGNGGDAGARGETTQHGSPSEDCLVLPHQSADPRVPPVPIRTELEKFLDLDY